MIVSTTLNSLYFTCMKYPASEASTDSRLGIDPAAGAQSASAAVVVAVAFASFADVVDAVAFAVVVLMERPRRRRSRRFAAAT